MPVHYINVLNQALHVIWDGSWGVHKNINFLPHPQGVGGGISKFYSSQFGHCRHQKDFDITYPLFMGSVSSVVVCL